MAGLFFLFSLFIFVFCSISYFDEINEYSFNLFKSIFPFAGSIGLNCIFLAVISIGNLFFAYLIKRDNSIKNEKLYSFLGVVLFSISYAYILIKIPVDYKAYVAFLNIIMGAAIGFVLSLLSELTFKEKHPLSVYFIFIGFLIVISVTFFIFLDNDYFIEMFILLIASLFSSITAVLFNKGYEYYNGNKKIT
ncbi:hypothetical protein [Providencia rettgeri]|uniref:hypothetical protein n=1 Tax=Providencia rettgeri TaxID=587 RepID=UPI0023AA3DB0|nr:hypothetical protein [Providencia rettgeri]